MPKKEKRVCQNCKKEFVIAPEDFAFYSKIQSPPPTFCPECRLQRRFAWKNARSIYKRRCDLCGEEKIGVYSLDKPYKVYCAPCWWSDKWDALEYGKEYDPSRTFFEQFGELMHNVPLVNRFTYENTLVRSEYTNMSNDLKDCYLAFHCEFSERCYYCEEIDHSNDCMDVSFVGGSELCYESFDLQKCFRTFFSRECENCLDSYFLKNCMDCRNCFGCVNLRHKQYYIFNKPYTKQTYQEELRRLGFDSGSYKKVQEFMQRAKDFQIQFPVKYLHSRHCINVSGEYIVNSKDAFYAFNVNGAENSKFLSSIRLPKAKDSYDWTIYGGNGELMYEILQAGGNVYNNHFGWCIWLGTRDVEYGILNIDSSNCFGSIGVRKKKYCILNKQYTKEDYKKLRETIIAAMNENPYQDKKGRVYRYGEFFPAQLSPFGYNETGAEEEFPLDEAHAREEGYQWADKAKYRGNYIFTKEAAELPDRIKEAGDELLKDIIACSACGQPYRIIPQELVFYRKQEIPLPRLCVECRYKERIKLKNPFTLYHRKCQCAGKASDGGAYQNMASHFHNTDHCPNEFQTSYPPDRPEIVYCEQCYLQEVV